MSVAARLMAKVEPCLMSGCWLWTDAPGRGGYGRLFVNGADRKAHRVSYEIHKGPVPQGLQVLHRCDTPACVNPAHLWLGTIADNARDRDAKGRQAKGEDAGPAKLTLEDVLEIKASPERNFVLAERFGVSRTAISLIRRGKNWKWAGHEDHGKRLASLWTDRGGLGGADRRGASSGAGMAADVASASADRVGREAASTLTSGGRSARP